MTNLASESSPSVQQEIFKSLLQTPHRSVDETLHVHYEQMERDPYLYACLAVHAVIEGQCAVRDIQDVFVATLFASEFSELRSAAFVMLQQLPPHRVQRVVQYLTGWSEIVRHRSTDKPMPAQGQFGLTYERAKTKGGVEIAPKTSQIGNKLRRHVGASEVTVNTYKVFHDGHKRRLNRYAASAIKNYLRVREENPSMMEGAMLRSRNSLKYLYAKAHLVPEGNDAGWINQALFRGVFPEGSRMEALRKLSETNDPTVQAQIVADAKLPYPTVKSLFESPTPSVTIASIMVMSDQELLQNQGMLKRDGAFDNPEIKEMIHGRLKKAAKSKKKVDALKGKIAAGAVEDLDDETRALISDVTDAQLKKHGSISVDTVLMIDKSYSLTIAIEQGKEVAAALAQACGENFKGCYLFDTVARLIHWRANDGDITKFSAWEKKLAMTRAGGGTDPVACLRTMIENGVDVEQIVIITDEDENTEGNFAQGLKEYRDHFGHMPSIVSVRLGRIVPKLERTCKAVGAEFSVMDCTKTDKIALPNLIQLCSKKSVAELVQEILALPLPTKEDWLASRPKKKRKSTKRDQPAMA